MKAAWARLDLQFRFVARTSRETLRQKTTWLLRLADDDGTAAYGECALFHGLSADDCSDGEFEFRLTQLCRRINACESLCSLSDEIKPYSALLMGLESAMCCHSPGGVLYPSAFTEGRDTIAINGLVWMGSYDEMVARVEQKIAEGFRCIKLKIGGIDFEDELCILHAIRQKFSREELELRLDANGAFKPEFALRRLERLAKFGIHSIEQPIAAGQREDLARICRESPIPIALDEELIGIPPGSAEKAQLLDYVRPAYVILKPTLCGGLSGAGEWVSLARERGIGSWYTSALESNVGLNAIAQAAYAEYGADAMPQGLGTGELYTNNISGPICRNDSRLSFTPGTPFNIPPLTWHEA